MHRSLTRWLRTSYTVCPPPPLSDPVWRRCYSFPRKSGQPCQTKADCQVRWGGGRRRGQHSLRRARIVYSPAQGQQQRVKTAAGGAMQPRGRMLGCPVSPIPKPSPAPPNPTHPGPPLSSTVHPGLQRLHPALPGLPHQEEPGLPRARPALPQLHHHHLHLRGELGAGADVWRLLLSAWTMYGG